MKYIYTLALALLISTLSDGQGFQQTNGPFSTGGYNPSIWAQDGLILTGFNNLLYRSDDSGESWELIDSSFDFPNVNPTCITKVGDHHVMGTNEADRVYTSTDDGLTWTPTTEGLPNIFGFPSAVPTHAASSESVVIMGGTNFAHRSTDEGQTWEALPFGGVVYGIEHVNERWYVCTVNGFSPPYKTFTSDDNGETWQEDQIGPLITVNENVDTDINSLAGLNGNLYATTGASAGYGLYKSTDNGATWSPLGSFDIGIHIENYDGTLYLTAYGGMWKSSDEGESWEQLMDGDLVGSYGTGHFDRDGDKIWIATGQGPMCYNIISGEIEGPFLPSATPTIIESEGAVSLASEGENLFATTDFGNTWNDLTANIPIDNINEVINMNIDGGEWFITLSSLNEENELIQYLFTSSDNGQSFSEVDLPEGTDPAAFMSFNPQILSTGLTGESIKFWRREDGQEWQEAEVTFLGDPPLEWHHVVSIERYNSILIADAIYGFAYSTDDGESWTYRRTLADDKVYGHTERFIRMRNNPNTGQGHIEASTDQGETWALFEEGFPSTQSFLYPEVACQVGEKVIIKNGAQGNFFEGDVPGGFYSVLPGEEEWSLEEDLGVVIQKSTSFQGREMNELYLGVENSGVWLNSDVNSSINPASQQLAVRVFPNPASDFLWIDTPSTLENYKASIFDLHGRLVLQHNGIGSQRGIDISNLQKGTYLLRLYGGAFHGAVKFVKW